MNSVIDATDRVGLDQVAARSLEKCMGACQGEQIGIVFDEKRRDIAEERGRASARCVGAYGGLRCGHGDND